MKEALLKTSALTVTPQMRTDEIVKVHYVGESDAMHQRLRLTFDQVTSSKNLLQASRNLKTGAKPDVVLIDTPFSVRELNHVFRHIASEYPETVVVCNKPCVDERDLPDIRKSLLIDDVFDFEADTPALLRKLRLLHHAKASQEKPVTKADCGYEYQCSSFTMCIKRILDLAMALMLVVLLSPVMLLVAIAIWLESGGPIIYSSLRVGKGYRIFRFYKFRTMVQNADKMIKDMAHLNQYQTKTGGPTFIKIADDPRVTRLGRFLRNTSLDELPQLFNVIKGDMSIVGNRPLPLYEAETLTTNEFMERFCAPAGITGLWQIKKRGQADMSVEERVSLDIAYARSVNTITDFQILMATPKALFQRSNV